MREAYVQDYIMQVPGLLIGSGLVVGDGTWVAGRGWMVRWDDSDVPRPDTIPPQNPRACRKIEEDIGDWDLACVTISEPGLSCSTPVCWVRAGDILYQFNALFIPLFQDLSVGFYPTGSVHFLAGRNSDGLQVVCMPLKPENYQ